MSQRRGSEARDGPVGASSQELNRILIDAYRQNWRVTRGKKYFKLWCPCPGKHKANLHISPSGTNYEQNWRSHKARTTCWKET